jgi:hypothetical protein
MRIRRIGTFIRRAARGAVPAAAWQRALVGGAAVAVGAWGVWMPASASASVSAAVRPAALRTVTFGYVGPMGQNVTVPAGVTYADVRVIGGHGGSTGGTSNFVVGGDGAQVSGLLPVYPGQVLTLYVAGAGGTGSHGSPGGGGWGATGYGGSGGNGSGLYGAAGAGGGGASGIESGPNTFVLAGGGGGGGGTGFDYMFDRGGPGGSSSEFGADPGHNGKGPGAGAGGAGAATGEGPGGGGGNSSYNGGGGGGGGAGWLGGAGGGGGGFGAGGGGGGGAGAWHYSLLLRDPRVIRGSTSDGNGLIIITWITGNREASQHVAYRSA